MKVCPNGAIYKEDEFGAVLVDQDKCEGCRKCYEACPYGSPKFASDEQGAKMSKCTMCVDRLAEGMQPACTASCPLRNPREKTPLIPYDVDEAIRLNQQRGDLGTMFESEEDLTTFDEGTIRRDELVMKHANNAELMRATRNDMA